jgi:HEAT repeat protein
MYFYLVFKRVIRVIQTNFFSKWSVEVNQLLAELIADDDLSTKQCVEKYTHKFKKLPIKREAIKLIVEGEIVRFHQQFTGKTAEVLSGLYLALELEKIAYKRLKDSNWENQVHGITILAQLNIKQAAPKVLFLCDDEIATLRMEAQAAFLKLSDTAPFRFLDRAREHILEWHQLVLLEVITKAQDLSIPSFSQWLASKNDTVVILCLKLIRQYQQFEAIPNLLVLLNHPTDEVRLLAVELLGQFEAYAHEEELIQRYVTASHTEKIAILHALGQIESGKHLDFLQAQLVEDSYDILFNALLAIKKHGTVGEGILKKLYATSLPKNRQLIDHLSDHRLNH